MSNCDYCDEPITIGITTGSICDDCQAEIELEEQIYDEEYHESLKVEYGGTE